MTAPLRRPLAVLAALTCVVIWAVNYPAMKVAFREISPLAFTGWRFLLATTLLFAEALVRRERLVPPPGARGLALLLALSGVGMYQWLYALGLASTSGFSAALLNSVSPLIAMLLVVLLGWERMSPLAGAGSLLAWGGVALFVLSTRGVDFGSTTGNLMCLGAATSWAVYNVASVRAGRFLSPRGAQLAAFGGGSVLILAYALPDMLRQDYSRVTLSTWSIVVFSAVLPLAVAFRLWLEAVRTLGVAQATSFGFLVPVLAGVASAIFTGERFNAEKILSAAVVLSGLAVIRFARERTAA
ncbi:MAG TPA: DMT family transporter [Thermoanaerobaculia bacterium]